MPQSWLRVLVYDWVTLLCLWSSLSLSIFSYVPALPSICLLHLYGFTVCFLHALSCGVSLLLFILSSSFPPPLSPSFCCSPCLSASCYCNHLFTQPVAHFLPSLVSYSLILSDFGTLTQEKALLFSLPNIVTNSDHVSVCLRALMCTVHMCMCARTCEAALHKLQKKHKHFVTQFVTPS